MTGRWYGVSWYGNNASIAQTGYIFTAEEASKVAQDGAEAPDFWAWAQEQEFTIDELSDCEDLPVVRADAELESQSSDEFTAWPEVAWENPSERVDADPLAILVRRGVVTTDPGGASECCGMPRDADGFCQHRPEHPIYVRRD